MRATRGGRGSAAWLNLKGGLCPLKVNQLSHPTDDSYCLAPVGPGLDLLVCAATVFKLYAPGADVPLKWRPCQGPTLDPCSCPVTIPDTPDIPHTMPTTHREKILVQTAIETRRSHIPFTYPRVEGHLLAVSLSLGNTLSPELARKPELWYPIDALPATIITKIKRREPLDDTELVARKVSG